jgi:arsenate reductase-like glutaredoxin family protein
LIIKVNNSAQPIKLFGKERCHKKQHYKTYLKTRKLYYAFLNIGKTANAEELRNLYENREIKFSCKYHSLEKVKNPSNEELQNGLTLQQMQVH